MRHLLVAVIALLLGLSAGLYYAWGVNPVQYTDTAPVSLRADDKTEYMEWVARAYAVDGNLDRARTRLAALGETNIPQKIAAQAQQTAASGGDAQAVRALAVLASALGAGPAPATSVAVVTLAPSATPLPSVTPVPTVTPQVLPTRAPTPTPPGALVFSGKSLVCDVKLRQPLIQVLALNAAGEQLPGVEVLVEKPGGFDHFFTGLKPELGKGYGDFVMTPGEVYALRLAASPAAVVAGLTVEPCADETGQEFSGSWQVVFSQP